MYTTYSAGTILQPIGAATSLINGNPHALISNQSNHICERILMYCIAGTFGLLSPGYLHASAATANWHINQIEIGEDHKLASDQGNIPIQDIAHIREVTKISVSELARVVGVSRQAVHEWIKGGSISPKNAEQLSELTQVINIFLKSGINVTPQILRRKIENGPSILESLNREGIAVELAQTLVKTLLRESQQRQRLASRFSGRISSPLTDIDFGTPHFNEDV